MSSCGGVRGRRRWRWPVAGAEAAEQPFPRQRVALPMEHGGGKTGGRDEEGRRADKGGGKRQDGGWERKKNEEIKKFNPEGGGFIP